MNHPLLAPFGPLESPVGTRIDIRLGALTWRIDVRENELRLHESHERDPLDAVADRVEVEGGEEYVDAPATERILRTPTDLVHVVPLLAPRAFVTQPDLPLTLRAGDRATLFVTTPIDVGLTDQPMGAAFASASSAPRRETWFGASTRNGEICFAARTKGRLHREELLGLRSRATTAIHLRNDARGLMRIERLYLPLPALSLYSTTAYGFVTNDLTIVHRGIAADDDVQVQRDIPIEGAELVREPALSGAGVPLWAASIGKLWGAG